MELNREQEQRTPANNNLYEYVKRIVAAVKYKGEGDHEDVPSILRKFAEGYEQKIKELTEENERLHASCTEFERKCASLNDENERLSQSLANSEAENERLRKNLETFKGKQKSLQKQREVLLKENHLLLIKNFDITVGDYHIVFSNGKKGNIYTFTEKDQIAKEMLEGDK